MAGRFNPDEYIGVHERIAVFYERHPEGRVVTEIVEHVREEGFIMMKASVYRGPDDAEPAATGHAWDKKGSSNVTASSYVEKCETDSVGRALANLGLEVKREQSNGSRRPAQPQRPAPQQQAAAQG